MSTTPSDVALPVLEFFHCPSCGFLHPRKPTLVPAEVAYITSYALATVYTYHSRGGILPRPVRNGRGNPRWSACAIARWLHGALAPDELQPVRPARVPAR